MERTSLADHASNRRLQVLAERISARLASTGGRPGLHGATHKPKIPIDPARWAALARLAETVSGLCGRSVTPGQVAGHLLSMSVDRVRPDRDLTDPLPDRRR